MSLARIVRQSATYADLYDIPPTWRGEVIDGTLYAFPRPYADHAYLKGRIAADLYETFDRARQDGPKTWLILPEPGIQHPRAPEYAPDLAAWRRVPGRTFPLQETISIVPDWICEIVSDETRAYDTQIKRPFYAQIGVAHLWYVDLGTRRLTISRLVDGHWLDLAAHTPHETVRAEPFTALEINLASFWEALAAEGEEELTSS